MRTAETKVNRKSESVQSSVWVDSIGFDLKEQGSTSTQELFSIVWFFNFLILFDLCLKMEGSLPRRKWKGREQERVDPKKVSHSLHLLFSRFNLWQILLILSSLFPDQSCCCHWRKGRKKRRGRNLIRPARVIQLTKLIISWKRERAREKKWLRELSETSIFHPSSGSLLLWTSTKWTRRGERVKKQTRKGENSFSSRIGVEERLDLIFSFFLSFFLSFLFILFFSSLGFSLIIVQQSLTVSVSSSVPGHHVVVIYVMITLSFILSSFQLFLPSDLVSCHFFASSLHSFHVCIPALQSLIAQFISSSPLSQFACRVRFTLSFHCLSNSLVLDLPFLAEERYPNVFNYKMIMSMSLSS